MTTYRRSARVLDTESIQGANVMESASRTGPVHYRATAVGGVKGSQLCARQS